MRRRGCGRCRFAVEIDRPLDKLFNLIELQWLFDAKARLQLGSPSIFSIFLDLRELESSLAYGFFANPARHDFSPAIALEKCKRRILIGIGANLFGIDILPVVPASA